MIGNKMNSIIQEDLAQICQENLDWNVLSGKNILITGANGILPSYIVETIFYLLKLGKIKNTLIFALVRNKEKADNRFKDYLHENCIHFLYQDVCDPVVIKDRIDIIIHAASQASPKYYGIDPVGTLAPNILGTINLLKLAKEKNVENFLFFCSSEAYGSLDNNNAIKETDFGYTDPMNVRSCYAESKRMGETICASWFHQFKIPVKIVRPFHTYGPGMSTDDGRVFADFTHDILNNNDIVIKSDGSARRAYCYLTDAISGYFHVLLNGQNGEAYNVGNPHQEFSVKELATTLVKIFPEKSLKLVMNPEFANQGYLSSSVNRILPDISKLQKLGWKPKVDVKTGFRRTILSYI